MTQATWKSSGLPFGGAEHRQGRRKTTSVSRSSAMAALGSVVYAARLEDGTIKVGWTRNFEDRLRYLSHHTGQDVELLAFRLGDYEEEQELHRSLSAHRIEGTREYYHPHEPVLAAVNAMRSSLNMSPITA